MSNNLATVFQVPLDEAFALTRDFNLDRHPYKVSLGAGVYRDENSKPWVLPSVKKAKEIIHQTADLDHEYLPAAGSTAFLKLAKELILGQSGGSASNVLSFQTISGTGANHIGASFLGQHLRPRHVFISDPSWSNHHLVWEVGAPNVTRKEYPYYKSVNRSFDLQGMLSTLESEAVENDIVILHACAHNPTGIDPTCDQWREIARLFARKKLFAFFDCAYQGFATGDLDEDAWAVRHFHNMILEATEQGPAGMCVAQSFAKSFGLYGERVGAFHLILPVGVLPAGANSQIMRLVRAEMSNPPLFGARIVQTILSDARLRTQWEKDLKTIAGRIKDMRSLLRRGIELHPESGNWSHLEAQIGMFSYTGLDPDQVMQLREKHHIYLMTNGRASLSGINPGNVGYVADAIAEVIIEGQQEYRSNVGGGEATEN